MWLFTKYGFYSVVCARKNRMGPMWLIDHESMMVRARVRKHLEVLKEHFPDSLGELLILESDATDYPFRIIVDKADWVKVAAALAEEIDYGNFKGKVVEIEGNSKYERVLLDIWYAGLALQEQVRKEKHD